MIMRHLIKHIASHKTYHYKHPTSGPPLKPTIFHAADHGLSAELLDPNAYDILERLHHAGFVAYLVGGGIRDLLSGIRPKDYDISTDATPEQLKSLFKRQCLLIGRRFRLAHIRYGHDKIYEVSTFRAGTDPTDDELIVRDNQWGTPEEDVLRRDFTINGLFYDPIDNLIIDYVGGCQDIKDGIIRTIGDPRVRFCQDPVRMIRLLKFNARLGFEMEDAAKEALVQCRNEITKSAPARVLEEMFRMMESGYAVPFFQLMLETGMLQEIFPGLATILTHQKIKDPFELIRYADELNRPRSGSVSRPVLAASLIYPLLAIEIHQSIESGEEIHLGAMIQRTEDLVEDVFCSTIPNFPRRTRQLISYVLSCQLRLTPPSGRRTQSKRVAGHDDFYLAVGLLRLRTLADSTLAESFIKWQEMVPPDAAARSKEKAREKARSRRPRGRRRPRE